MKVLLLTDIPPCKNYTAGLVLERLVSFMSSDQIALCAIVNPTLAPIIPADMKSLPLLWLKKPQEKSIRLRLGKLGRKAEKLGVLFTCVFELFQSFRVRYSLLPKVVAFAKQQQVDAIWVVLQGQTIVRLAYKLPQALHIPLFSQVWDPFEWWLRDNHLDLWTQKRLLNKFDNVIRHSHACATASWAMSENYSRKYGIVNLPVIAGLPISYAKKPATCSHNNDDFILGMAGQLYAQEEWNCLIDTLNKVNWKIAGKSIRIRLIGAKFQMTTSYPVNFEYFGWQSQEDTIRLLSEADLLYLPYWFSEEFHKESSNSFPSKLVTYFATGRPVLCHAPAYASPAKYIKQYEAGYLCESLDSAILLKQLEHTITDVDHYRKVTENGSACFIRDFTLENMKAAFFKFLPVKN